MYTGPAVSSKAVKYTLCSGLLCLVGLGEWQRQLLDHATVRCTEEPTGTVATARGAWALWQLLGRFLADMAHTKGWVAFAALRSDVSRAQVLFCP